MEGQKNLILVSLQILCMCSGQKSAKGKANLKNANDVVWSILHQSKSRREEKSQGSLWTEIAIPGKWHCKGIPHAICQQILLALPSMHNQKEIHLTTSTFHLPPSHSNLFSGFFSSLLLKHLFPDCVSSEATRTILWNVIIYIYIWLNLFCAFLFALDHNAFPWPRILSSESSGLNPPHHGLSHPLGFGHTSVAAPSAKPSVPGPLHKLSSLLGISAGLLLHLLWASAQIPFYQSSLKLSVLFKRENLTSTSEGLIPLRLSLLNQFCGIGLPHCTFHILP